MPSSALAVFGGPPAVPVTFRPYPSVGAAEAEAVAKVVASGSLSGFYGSWGDEFLGGPTIKAFEAAWSKRFGAKHTVSVNSATSGLMAALGAVGVTPGSEVIVSPYTMSASATSPLLYGGVPVFVDIDPETFTLDVAAVKKALNKRTKAIVVVNLFGHPAKLHELRALADEHGVALIEDNAQGPLAKENGKHAGTIGHIGVFSLNYHKHIHTGEGGMCTTEDDELARKMQMIRNHAENIVEPLEMQDPTNMIGFNFRMTEMSAAVGLAQLANVDAHVRARVQLAERLSAASKGLEGLTPPVVRDGCEHVYYLWGLRIDEKKLGLTRAQFSKALAAEGFPHFLGYLRPLYYLPVFQKRIAFGEYPFNLSNVQYPAGLCPVAERMWKSELLCYETCAHQVSPAEAELLGEAIRKVHAHRDELRSRASELGA
jgi:dTDP-4-amino-4,6-dideoxygalactose transaminase